ncbi:hypothetical protein RUND412_006566 [Rhizina undulata]
MTNDTRAGQRHSPYDKHYAPNANLPPSELITAGFPFGHESIDPTSASMNVYPLPRIRRQSFAATSLLVLVSMFVHLATSQSTSSSDQCISLSSSRTCSAFNKSSVSTSASLQGQYPFLAYVGNTDQFDTQFERYIAGDYAKQQYQDLFGCSNVTFTNTTDLYARYTRSYLCSRMIQDSKSDCNLTAKAATPICADSCAEYAISEQVIVSDTDICGTANADAIDLIRAEFTVCSMPADSLSGNCIPGSDNEDTNCGYADNLPGLCLYCSSSSPNSTDSCCYASNIQGRCTNVELPTTTTLPPLFSTSATGSPTSSLSPHSSNGESSSLSGGEIAGITVGSLAGMALIALLFLFLRRRRKNQIPVSVFNQPARRRSASMTFHPTVVTTASQSQGYEVLPGGRIARMSALETTGSEIDLTSPPPLPSTRIHRAIRTPSSSEFGLQDSPSSTLQRNYTPQTRPLRPPPRDRHASLSSTSILSDPNQLSSSENGSPGVISNPQSEQLAYFKDYYSSDDIHPNDKVSVLWAYQPRAPDEFELDRGDMLKIIGIWDDGWATGVRLSERAEDFARHRGLRDSGVSASQTSRASRHRISSPPVEVKAFPLVCVCLPEHWQKTIDADADYRNEGVPGIETQDDRLTEPSLSPSNRRLTGKSSSRFREDLNVRRPGPSTSP